MKRPTLALLIASLALAACTRGEGLHDGGPRVPRAARDAAATRTPGSGAGRTAELALGTALTIDPAFEELLLIAADTPAAVAYAFDLEASEQLHIDVRPLDDAAGAAIDIFEQTAGAGYRLAHTRTAADPFTFDAPTSGRYVLRIQPESGGGRYRVRVRGSAISVQFPVAGADAGSIRSGYGDARDAGGRSHEGVDIFAPRGTPVLSVAEAIVEAVQNTPAGGRVIWAKDATRDLSYYYAHLESQRVERGMRLSAGDTIGTVGNSGNARGASPHLHFGVYRPGTVPLDPLPLIGGVRALAELPDTAAQALGMRVQTRGTSVRLRGSPHGAGPILGELPIGTAMRITGVIGDWRRVVLDDGRPGFIASRLLQPVATGTH